MQQWVAVRSIVGLLLRFDADEDAAVLLGALVSRTTASPPYGADADRLASAHEELTRRLGPGVRDEAWVRGEAMRDDEVLVWILDVLRRLDPS